MRDRTEETPGTGSQEEASTFFSRDSVRRLAKVLEEAEGRNRALRRDLVAGELKAPVHYYCPGGDGSGGASDGVTDRDILCEGAHTLVRTKKRARSGLRDPYALYVCFMDIFLQAFAPCGRRQVPGVLQGVRPVCRRAVRRDRPT